MLNAKIDTIAKDMKDGFKEVRENHSTVIERLTRLESSAPHSPCIILTETKRKVSDHLEKHAEIKAQRNRVVDIGLQLIAILSPAAILAGIIAAIKFIMASRVTDQLR
jgi:hypothetical protein